MADDLGDEWWLPKGSSVGGNESNSSDITSSDKKRSHEAQNGTEEDAGEPVKKKRKRKRKKISMKLKKTEETAGTTESFREWLKSQSAGKKLSQVEEEELSLSDSDFIQHNEGKLSLSEYLKERIPDWRDLVKNSNPNETKSCTVLVLAASGMRAADLNRDAAEFKGKCTAVKLFAKHLKIKEQAALLCKKKTHFAVGTPGRVFSLIETGALTLEFTDFLILDWNWRDVKLRRMTDMPELNRDLFKLMTTFVIPAVNKYERIKIGLL